MDKNELIKKVFSSLQEKGKFNLHGLREYFSKSPSKLGDEITFLAHISCYNLDRRKIKEIIPDLNQKNEKCKISSLLRQSILYSDYKNVFEILKICKKENLPEISKEYILTWFRERGIKYFDLYFDEENEILFSLVEDLKEIDHFVNENYKNPKDFYQRLLDSEDFSKERKEILKNFLKDKTSKIKNYLDKRKNINEVFKKYCQENGIVILRKLQNGRNDKKYSSNVYLILDKDGIIKTCKEVLDNSSSPILNLLFNENQILNKLKKYHEIVEIKGNKFLSKFFIYGEKVSNYCLKENLLKEKEVESIISSLAKGIQLNLENGVIHLDIKGENSLLYDSKVEIFDYGTSRISKNKLVHYYLTDPRYTAPEAGINFLATEKSEVFSLGVLWYYLLNGEHPFSQNQDYYTLNREEEILNYFIPNIFCELNKDVPELLKKMLDKDPKNRPTFKEISASLKYSKVIQKNRREYRKEKNTALFIGRFGIPHKGHIEYIRRTLETGFFLKISLQRSYTLTEKDPIHKIFVAQIIKESLKEFGFIEGEHYEFLFTPFFESDDEHKLHFTMMQDYENIVAVVSSNKSVHELFQDKLILDQKAFFGCPGKEYMDKSWGERLRNAIRNNESSKIEEYAPSGLNKVLSVKQIQEMYAKPNIKFVKGKVSLIIQNRKGEEIETHRLRRYSNPLRILEKFPNTRYKETIFNGEDELIIFQIK